MSFLDKWFHPEEEKKKEGDTVPYKNVVPIRFSAYDVLAKCLKLRLIKDNIYEDNNGKQFICTSYGFMETNKTNSDLRIKSLNKIIERNESLLESCKLKITALENFSNQRDELIKSLRKEIKEQAKTIKECNNTILVLKEEISKLNAPGSKPKLWYNLIRKDE